MTGEHTETADVSSRTGSLNGNNLDPLHVCEHDVAWSFSKASNSQSRISPGT